MKDMKKATNVKTTKDFIKFLNLRRVKYLGSLPYYIRKEHFDL
jgi:hypothetical protein